MSQKIATSRFATYAAALVAVVAGVLVLTASASANTFTANDTASFLAAVSSANSTTGPNTIVLAGGNYVPTATITFTNKTGPLTIVDQTYSQPPAKIVGSSVQPYPSPLFAINSGVTVNFNNIAVSAAGGPGTTAIDNNGTANFDQSLIAGTIGSGLLVEPGASASATNSEFSDGNDFGIVNQGTATLTNVTIAYNAVGGLDTSSGSTTMINTIVAKNGGATPTDCLGKPASPDHSLDSDGSCGVGVLSKTDPLLVSNPTYNGGSHPTHYLKTGSPAIDAANSAKCPAVDERNVPRPDDAGTACDIGAVEWNNTPPVWTVADVTKATQSTTGAVVNYTATVSSTDDIITSKSCTPASGSTFPIGATTVNCTATDGYGATGTASFKVTVFTDTTPPVIAVPAPITATATSASGAPVTYSVTVTDPDDTVASQACSPASGSTFPLGTTTVNCTATDSAGNTATKSFTVTVISPTSTAVTSSNNPSLAGQSVTFTATVTPQFGSGETGTVQFKDGASNLGSAVTLSGNAATLTTALAGGTHSITAVYSGDSKFATSTSPALTQTVDFPLTATGAPALTNGVEGSLLSSASPASGVVATFTDADPAGTASQFTATIDWGDGSTSAGVVSPASGGGFQVSGSHTYVEDGSYPVSVSIVDVSGATASATTSSSVAEPSNAIGALLDKTAEPLPIIGQLF